MTKKATKSITDITMTAQAEGTKRLSEVNDDEGGSRIWSRGEIVPESEDREKKEVHETQEKEKH